MSMRSLGLGLGGVTCSSRGSRRPFGDTIEIRKSATLNKSDLTKVSKKQQNGDKN
jgi:hypothetical protein